MEAFGQFYIMSITMIFGSLVAGSTPVGGGAVAFPVMVLFIKLSAEDGRDFSLMIQSVAGLRRAFHLFFFNLFHVFPGLWEDDAIFIYIYMCVCMYIYIYIWDWLKPHVAFVCICCIPGGHVLCQLPDSVCQATLMPFLAHSVDDHQRSSRADSGFGSCHQ